MIEAIAKQMLRGLHPWRSTRWPFLECHAPRWREQVLHLAFEPQCLEQFGVRVVQTLIANHKAI